jgi:hypothetical protein
MKIIHLTVAVALSTIKQSTAFAPAIQRNSNGFKQQRKFTKNNVLDATAPSDSNEAPNDANAGLQNRTCIRNFLTQRSLQSFMFLLNEMKDPHTNQWLGEFLGSSHKTLLSFHGSGALDLERFYNWDHVFNELMVKPLDAVIVELKPRGEGRGLSKNNPYRMLEVSSNFFELVSSRDIFLMASGILMGKSVVRKIAHYIISRFPQKLRRMLTQLKLKSISTLLLLPTAFYPLETKCPKSGQQILISS